MKIKSIWDDHFNNFEGKFFGNICNRKEFVISKIYNEKLVEKSEKIWNFTVLPLLVLNR